MFHPRMFNVIQDHENLFLLTETGILQQCVFCCDGNNLGPDKAPEEC